MYMCVPSYYVLANLIFNLNIMLTTLYYINFMLPLQ